MSPTGRHRSTAGRRPLHFEVANTVPARWDGFDVAFSHEVLYLLDDLLELTYADAWALLVSNQ
jgi:hypothetical protein